MDLTGYEPKIRFSITKKGYTVKTAEDISLLEKTFRLRHDVFYREYIGYELENGIDFDEFDMTCDHLVIMHEDLDYPVGTYRFRCSKFVDNYYTQTEFDCDSFLATAGTKLEMGRACIHKDHRNGTVMNLLFRGLAEYIKQTESELLFGCSSVKFEDPILIARFIKTLNLKGAMTTEWDVNPNAAFTMHALKEIDIDVQEPLPEEQFDEMLPGLLSAYVKAGSRFVGLPAHDAKFHCIDLFTVLSVDNLMNLFRRKYVKKDLSTV